LPPLRFAAPWVPGLLLLSSLFTRLPLLRTLGCTRYPPHLLNELSHLAVTSASFDVRSAPRMAPRLLSRSVPPAARRTAHELTSAANAQ
jgi:hypothetical protein